jgi:hypothetical protein
MSDRRQLRIATDKLRRQIEARKWEAKVTTRGFDILTAVERFEGGATRKQIASINKYSIGGVCSSEVDSLHNDRLITKERIIVKNETRSCSMLKISLTDKGVSFLDYILTGKGEA